MKTTVAALALFLLLASAAIAARRDPLNNKEADQIREASMEAEKRLPLFAQFARVRLETVEHLRSDPRFGSDRGPQIHDLLEDFTTLVDELGDNIDDFVQRGDDVRKPLKTCIESLTSFQLKLRTIKETKDDPQFAKEFRDYGFALDSAIDSVNSGLDSAKKTMEEQEKKAAEEKEKQKRKKK
jgi:ABC-type transporter Mla subunit MlaD